MTDKKERLSDKSDEEVIKLALKRFKIAEDADNQIREKQLDDLKFRAGDQWPANVVSERNQQLRPCLTINRMPTFIRQVTNDARQNRPQIKVIATDDSTVEQAEIIEGMIRHIQVSSNADIAYDTACDNQVTMGRGYLRIITEYCGHDSFDQDIKIKPVKNQFSVYFDPACVEPDYCDAMYAFVTADEDKDEYKLNNPDSPTCENMDLSGVGDASPGWVTTSSVRVAEYFEVVKKPDTLYLMVDGQTVLKSDLKKKEYVVADNSIFDKDGVEVSQIKDQRPTHIRQVIWRKITAWEILEEKLWAGQYIPIIPVLGEDLNIDGERDLVGLIRYAKDPQRQYNYWSTAATEAIALAPKAPWVIAEGQIEGYEKYWKTANVKNYSHLPYKPTSVDGHLVPAPQRNMAEPPIQAMTMAIQQAAADMKNTTGIHDASLGSQGNEVSGKAIMARQREGDTSNFHYIDNLSRSQRFLGIQIIDLIPIVYDAPRMIGITHQDGTSEVQWINQYFGEKDENGQPKIYDMKKGKYDIAVVTGPSFTTKRQEAAATLTQMVQAYPPMMQMAGDLVVKSMDFDLADELSERFKKMLPPQLQDDENEEIPPQLKAKMTQAQQMIDQLTQELHATHDELEVKTQESNSKNGELALKQADLEIKKVEVGIKQEELQLKKLEVQSKAELEHKKIDADVTKARYQTKAAVSPDVAMSDPDLQENGESPLKLIVEHLSEAIQQQSETTMAGLTEVARSQQHMANTIAQGNAMLASAMSQPKTVKYGEDGRILGVS